ncbi:MAG: DNA gyrase subunit A [Oscillospiraceae bacterium]|nr:DNA gyrase subunit A [Oscillospiraceae bacterium]
MDEKERMDQPGGRVIQVDLEKHMKSSFLQYAMSVIVSRALPDVRDGLKPVHRRILYTMNEEGIVPSKPHKKCAATVGSVLGKYHPHGDASVYDALVRLAQDFSMRAPLVDGHGNFGSVDGDPPAAYRYTEARMSKISTLMLSEIEKDTVDFQPNYDDSLKEPVVLPARFPNLLVNGSSGIAVGMATNIPPHNLREVTNGICYLIDHPEAEFTELMEHIPGPDFPTAGIIMGMSGIRSAYATGRGKITLRGRAEIQEDKNGKERIVITELPYQVNKARLQEAIADLVKDKRVEGITNIRDESDQKGMHVVIELRRDANAQVVLNKLYTYTQLQDTVGVIMLALVNGEPKLMGLKEILTHYIKFQEEIITKRTIFDLRKARERAHILEGLVKALDFIDEVVSILRSSKNIPEGKARLMERLGLDEIQADYVVQMTLGKLTGLEKQKICDELDAIRVKIAEFEALLADERKILNLVKEEAMAVADKFGDERRTEIVPVSGEVDVEDLIPEENCVLTLTHYGYIKRQPVDTYRLQKRGGRGVSGMTRREEDFVEELFVCSSHDYVLFFSSAGKVYRLKCYEVPESSRTARGTNIVNLLPLEEGEKITSMIRIQNFEEGKYLCMCTQKGILKRTDLSAYQTARKGGLRAINLDEGDVLGWVRLTDGNDELLIGTQNGLAIRIAEEKVRAIGRTARGVKALSLQDGDQVVGMEKVNMEGSLLTVTQKGQGRRSPFTEYRLQNRGGKGIINYKITEKSGIVAGIRTVTKEDDAIMITDEGVIIRVEAESIALQSRYAGGVRVMRVENEAHVVTVARADHEEEAQKAEAATEGEPSEEEIRAMQAAEAAAEAETPVTEDENP